ncbi:MAG: hypothetical protein ACRDF7_10410 [Candidatus Limnocylindrales bacterium]
MIHAALGRPVPVELTDDRRIVGRVKRLAATSAVALGLIWALAVSTLAAPPAVGIALAAGWLLMPTTLIASLRRSDLRYGLIVPATLVSVALLATCLGWLPATPIPALGWVLTTAGVLLGGGMGVWLWFRVMPVPAALDDPSSAWRWRLIAVHVGLIVVGVALSSLALLHA